jgi:DNA-binding transcriptional LysR family regulator
MFRNRAVTSAIQQLERIIGNRLFDRNPNGVSLTANGNRFLPRARNILAAVNEAISIQAAAGSHLYGGGLLYAAALRTLLPNLSQLDR